MRILLWAVAVAGTVACFAFQNRTGPTYPLEGTIETARGTVAYHLLRSEEIGTPLLVTLKEPVPEGVTARVRYRRYRSNDGWTEAPMVAGTFAFARRGSRQELRGVGTMLPSLKERAGKYEYVVLLDDGTGVKTLTGDRPVQA